MKQTTIKIIRLLLLNAKWIMLGILLLNLFVFGYWSQMTEYGLCVEETFWGIVIVAALVAFFAFDKVWKKLVEKICSIITSALDKK